MRECRNTPTLSNDFQGLASSMPALITILRPLNLFQAFLAVILTTLFLGQWHDTRTLILLLLSVLSVNGAGNVINDIYDLEIDRVNRPDRPLPSGQLSQRSAWIYTWVLFAMGAGFAAFISLGTFIIAGPISMTLLIAYSAKLKRSPLLGNLVVSIMLGLAFIYVGTAFRQVEATLVMALLAFGFTMIREIIKDLEDMEGDARDGARTLPLVLGEEKSSRLVVFMMLVFAILDLLPYWLGAYGPIYFWLVLIGINLPLLFAAWYSTMRPGRQTYARVQLFLKLDIFVGLAALYFGRNI